MDCVKINRNSKKFFHQNIITQKNLPLTRKFQTSFKNNTAWVLSFSLSPSATWGSKILRNWVFQSLIIDLQEHKRENMRERVWEVYRNLTIFYDNFRPGSFKQSELGRHSLFYFFFVIFLRTSMFLKIHLHHHHNNTNTHTLSHLQNTV